jgi:hypothetical protein
VSFSDRLRAWFRGEGKRTASRTASHRASRVSTEDLEAFVASRIGVEAYLEPKTAIYSTTLLLVADDGEYLRRPVRDRSQAAAFCGQVNIPLYEAAKVGYPRRMRDYDQGVRPRRVDLSELPPWPGGADDLPPADGPPPPPRQPRSPSEDPDGP